MTICIRCYNSEVETLTRVVNTKEMGPISVAVCAACWKQAEAKLKT